MARRVRRRVVQEPVVTRDVEEVDEDEVVHRSIERAPWSPAQIVSLIVGLIFAIIGTVALARAGLDFDNIETTHTQVAGMHHTALLGLIELFVGLVLIGIGAMPGGARGGMNVFGVLLLGFGIVVMIEPTSFHRWLGTHTGNGWFWLITGVVLLATAMLAPTIFGYDRRAVSRRGEVVEEL